MVAPMLFLKLLALAISFIVCVAVGVRNINRDFHPAFRSHMEVFLAGVPVGFIGMLILIPDWPEASGFGVLTGLLIGLGLSYSTPRQWRYWNVPRLPKNRSNNHSSP